MPKHITTQQRTDEYQTINPLLESVYTELKAFASKKQDGHLNHLKVNAINKILSRAQKLLEGESFSEFLELLDADSMPSNSDAVIVVTHYRTALKAFRSKYSTSESFGFVYSWNRENEEDEVNESELPL